ncbi:MAG TPA: helix-turn-helix domain-containing protein [Candidatus Thermoplasmatota archaeon]|nr:helix-turn-helix domain-containing protein [Candidatus Thermoplasmatota archaeon]
MGRAAQRGARRPLAIALALLLLYGSPAAAQPLATVECTLADGASCAATAAGHDARQGVAAPPTPPVPDGDVKTPGLDVLLELEIDLRPYVRKTWELATAASGDAAKALTSCSAPETVLDAFVEVPDSPFCNAAEDTEGIEYANRRACGQKQGSGLGASLAAAGRCAAKRLAKPLESVSEGSLGAGVRERLELAPQNVRLPRAAIPSASFSTGPVVVGAYDAARNALFEPRTLRGEVSMPSMQPSESVVGSTGTDPAAAVFAWMPAHEPSPVQPRAIGADDPEAKVAGAADASQIGPSSQSEPSARLAEAPRAPPRLDPPLLLAFTTVAGLLALAASLFSRIGRERVLDHALRARLCERLRDRGAATASALARDLGVDRTTAEYHLQRLLAAGIVRAPVVGSRRVWALAGQPDAPLHRAVSPTGARIHAEIASRPGETRAQIARNLQLSSALVRHHLTRLLAAQEIEERSDGVRRVFVPAPSSEPSGDKA